MEAFARGIDDLRGTRAIVDLDAIAGNVRAVAAHAAGGARVIAVVKANAYGHGAPWVARAALDAGAAMVAVATVDEGRQLRDAGISGPVLMMGPIGEHEAASAVAAGLEVAIGRPEQAAALAQAALAMNASAPVGIHVKIDTGMRRWGCAPGEALALTRTVAGLDGARLAGVMTHFACADDADEAPTLAQQALFDRALAEIAEAGIAVPLRHAANSAGGMRSTRYHYDAIRLGISLYGAPPSDDVALLPGMRLALRIVSRVSRVIDVAAGDRISYGGTYVALRDERAALFPVGYADGYRRALSNRGWYAHGETALPIRGRVCMDQTIAGIPDGAAVAVGDEVTVMADRPGVAPTALELAAMLETIPYEIFTSLAPRVPRLYSRGGHVVGVHDLSGVYEVR
jgi:alanine racemase